MSGPRARRIAAKLILVGALVVHGGLFVRAEWDDHKLFGFRPFNESDTWQVEIVRILDDGSTVPIDDGTWVYDWDELIGASKLVSPGPTRHASGGAGQNLDYLDRALDWAVDHIPDDHDTIALEATVTVFRNTRGPDVIVLRSERPPSR